MSTGLGYSGIFVTSMSVNMANFNTSVHGTIAGSITGIGLLGKFMWVMLTITIALLYRFQM